MKKKTHIDPEEEQILIEEDKKNIHAILKKVPVDMEINLYQENLAINLALIEGYNLTNCYQAAAGLERDNVKPALEISRMYDIPINELIHHIKRKKRGFGSALIAANFVDALRGYDQEITLEQGYSYWKVLENKINNKDYRAISQSEETVLISSGKHIKTGPANEIEGTIEDVTKEEIYEDWQKNWLDYANKEFDEERIIEESDPLRGLRAISLKRGGLYEVCGPTKVHPEDFNNAIISEEPEHPINNNILGKYIKDITGGGEIRTLDTLKKK